MRKTRDERVRPGGFYGSSPATRAPEPSPMTEEEDPYLPRLPLIGESSS
jgi:hypothetical protein